MIPLLVDLAGVWRLEVAVSTLTKLPVFGHTRSVSVDLARLEVRREGDRWRVVQEPCDTKIVDKGLIARSVIPAAFKRALPTVTYDLEVSETGAVRADLGAQAVGYDPRYPMPARTTDPGVIDWDKDGKPGATVLIEVPIVGGGEVYVAQIGRMVLSGALRSTDLIAGTPEMPLLRAATLGASNRYLDTTLDFTYDPANSWFTLTRQPEGSSCGDLLRKAPMGEGDRPK